MPHIHKSCSLLNLCHIHRLNEVSRCLHFIWWWPWKNYLLTSQYSNVLIHMTNAYTFMNKMYICHQEGQQWIVLYWHHWQLIKHSYNSLTTIINWSKKKYFNRNFCFSTYSYLIVDTQLVMHYNKRHVTFTLVKKSVHCNTVHIRSALFWDIMQCRMVVPPRHSGKTYRSHIAPWVKPPKKDAGNT